MLRKVHPTVFAVVSAVFITITVVGLQVQSSQLTRKVGALDQNIEAQKKAHEELTARNAKLIAEAASQQRRLDAIQNDLKTLEGRLQELGIREADVLFILHHLEKQATTTSEAVSVPPVPWIAPAKLTMDIQTLADIARGGRKAASDLAAHFKPTDVSAFLAIAQGLCDYGTADGTPQVYRSGALRDGEQMLEATMTSARESDKPRIRAQLGQVRYGLAGLTNGNERKRLAKAAMDDFDYALREQSETKVYRAALKAARWVFDGYPALVDFACASDRLLDNGHRMNECADLMFEAAEKTKEKAASVAFSCKGATYVRLKDFDSEERRVKFEARATEHKKRCDQSQGELQE